MALYKDYSIANDTLNGALIASQLKDEIQASAITVALDNISSTGDTVTITFKADITAEIATLDSVVAAHDGILVAIADPVEVESSPAFASKYTKDGKSLFKRVHGVGPVSVPVYDANDEANTVKTIELTISYPEAKFTGADIIGTELGDIVDFTVHDTDNNDISGLPTTSPYAPNIQLNQFGFNVVMTGGSYSNTSQYDASLYQGMKLRAKIKNMGAATKNFYMNVELHEVK